MIWLLPFAVFVLLAMLERSQRAPHAEAVNSAADHWLNLAGLAVQGALVPVAGYLLATRVFATHFPQWAGSLQIGWLGAFLLNFVVVDFLYYWQHRLFHRVPALWRLHRCHHQAPLVNVWATARNTLAVNFLFVYMLLNPLLGFLCDHPEGFFAAAMLTASLDLWRHARLPAVRCLPACLARILITPVMHHAHHAEDGQAVNFGANLSVWDSLFGSIRLVAAYPHRYGATGKRNPWKQFLFPW